MRLAIAVCSLLLLPSCFATSGVATNEATEQVDRAQKVQVDVALRQVATAEETYFAESGVYTTDPAALNVTAPPEINIVITLPSATDYCIQATHSGLADDAAVWHLSKSNPSIIEGVC